MPDDKKKDIAVISSLAPLGSMNTGRSTEGKDELDQIMDITVTKWVNRWEANLRATMAGMNREELRDVDEDLFVSALHNYSDAADVRIAQEGVNLAFKAGRAAGLQDMQPEIDRATQEIAKEKGISVEQVRKLAVWRRTSAMLPSSCGPCVAADGTEISGPDADLTLIHLGPPDSCLCLPYWSSSEIAN
jgi:hypothetical protein